MNAPPGSCFINCLFALPQRSALNNSLCLNLVKKKIFVKGLKTSCPFGHTSSSYLSDWTIKQLKVRIVMHSRAPLMVPTECWVVMWKHHGGYSIKLPKHCFTWTVDCWSMLIKHFMDWTILYKLTPSSTLEPPKNWYAVCKLIVVVLKRRFTWVLSLELYALFVKCSWCHLHSEHPGMLLWLPLLLRLCYSDSGLFLYIRWASVSPTCIQLIRTNSPTRDPLCLEHSTYCIEPLTVFNVIFISFLWVVSRLCSAVLLLHDDVSVTLNKTELFLRVVPSAGSLSLAVALPWIRLMTSHPIAWEMLVWFMSTHWWVI